MREKHVFWGYGPITGTPTARPRRKPSTSSERARKSASTSWRLQSTYAHCLGTTHKNAILGDFCLTQGTRFPYITTTAGPRAKPSTVSERARQSAGTSWRSRGTYAHCLGTTRENAIFALPRVHGFPTLRQPLGREQSRARFRNALGKVPAQGAAHEAPTRTCTCTCT